MAGIESISVRGQRFGRASGSTTCRRAVCCSDLVGVHFIQHTIAVLARSSMIRWGGRSDLSRSGTRVLCQNRDQSTEYEILDLNADPLNRYMPSSSAAITTLRCGWRREAVRRIACSC